MLRYAKRFTREDKSVILSEHLEGGVIISELSRKYQVSPHTVYIILNQTSGKGRQVEWCKERGCS